MTVASGAEAGSSRSWCRHRPGAIGHQLSRAALLSFSTICERRMASKELCMISRLSDSALRALATRLQELAIELSELASTSSISLVMVVRRRPYANGPDQGAGAARVSDVYARDTTLRGWGETSGSELETVFLLAGKAIPRISSIDRMRDARAHFKISCLKDRGLRRASNLESVARRTTSKSYDGGLVRGLDIQRSNGNVPTHDTQGPDSRKSQAQMGVSGLVNPMRKRYRSNGRRSRQID
jgi:hypothetical protein